MQGMQLMQCWSEVDPAVLESSRVIEGECRGLFVINPVQAGEHPQLDEKLESVADTEDQFSGGDESRKLIEEQFPAPGDGRMENPVRTGLGRTEVVAVEESAGQVQENGNRPAASSRRAVR